MIDGPDSPVTTQTNTSCLNNIPSRLVSWLYGKLVSIAEAVRRVFSRGNMGQSESRPEARPLAERTSSEVKAEITFHTPDPQVTAPSQEAELDNEANRPLPVLNGSKALRLSMGLKPILDGIRTIFEELRRVNSSELSEGKKRADDIKRSANGEDFDNYALLKWKAILHASQQIPYPHDKPANEKINFLLDCNARQMEIHAKCIGRANLYITDINGTILPSVDELISSLTKKYPDSCIELASLEDIKVLQEKVLEIQTLVKGVKGCLEIQIALDADLMGKFSDISKKLQNLTQILQM